MSPLATVLVPTHNHGPLLAHAVGSALDQSIGDIEIFVMGDGVDPVTRDVALQLCSRDRRVTFFDNEKGPRHGELLRHEALQQATGRIVCYLSDDDLWLPDHVAAMLDLLDGADFAHALPIGIRVDGTIFPWPGHLETATSRDRVVGFINFIPLSCGAHTLDRYRQLPHGWRTTPETISTDVYMWSQILEQPDCVARSGIRPTVLHFPTPWRREMTPEQRLEELVGWRGRIAVPGFEAELTSRVIADTARERAVTEDAVRALRERVSSLERELDRAQAQVQEKHTQLGEARGRVAQLESHLVTAQDKLTTARIRLEDQSSQLAKAHSLIESQHAQLIDADHRQEVYRARLERKQSQVDRMSKSFTWRTRERFLRLPGVARVTRSAGAARVRREAD
jgi:hypothetical protein